MATAATDVCKRATTKEKAMYFISRMSGRATWDDIMYEIYARQKIDEGLKASREGRVFSHDEVKKRFGINGNRPDERIQKTF